MNNEQIEMGFGELLRMAIDGKTTALPVAPSALHRTPNGAIMRLPTDGEQLAISAGDVPVTPSVGRIRWLETASIPILNLIPSTPVREIKGHLPIGGELPAVSMQREHETGSDNDPAITSIAYDMSSVIEAKTETSFQALMQAEGLQDAIQDSHQIALAEMILRQLLTGGAGHGAQLTATVSGGAVASVTVTVGGRSYLGPLEVVFTGGGGADAAATATMADGVITSVTVTEGGTGYTSAPSVIIRTAAGNNITALVDQTGVVSTDYSSADKGSDRTFRPEELAIEDAGGQPSAWVLGRNLESGARGVVVNPGGSRRVIEGREMLLSGVRTFRNSDLHSDRAIVADWGRAVQIVTGPEIEYVIDYITKPGDVRITSRLPIDILVTRPSLVRTIIEA